MKYILAALLSVSTIYLYGQKWTSGRPDGHAPMGVMGDHTHNSGEFMFSYRFMHMDMEGLRQKGESTNNQDVLNEYMITPVSMPMDMHMLGMMYAITDNLTAMAMINYVIKDMDHITRSGGMFSTSSSGIGDLKLTALYKVIDSRNQRIHINFGLGIPTGRIDQKDVTPASSPEKTQLPYPMQTGTGTFDISPGITYLFQANNLSGGAQIGATFRTGENNREYSFGNQFQFTPWLSYRIPKFFSFSFRLNYRSEGKLDGGDPMFAGPSLNHVVPTVSGKNFGGNYLFSNFGMNFYIPEGPLKNFRLGFEYELPLLRENNGTQLETDGMFTIGVQYSF